MNKQGQNGIEWTDYTWNVIAGCKHQCRWEMPGGNVAKCYAEEVAEGVAKSAYPNGFNHHYIHTERISEPDAVQTPSRIFIDSMSDLFGNWVDEYDIHAILGQIDNNPQHTFQVLTKNAPRLLKFRPFPSNLWVGVSMPPTYMFGKRLSDQAKQNYLIKALKVLTEINETITWMSFEPLSFDVAPLLAEYEAPISWAVIGAASNGRTKYQPNPKHVSDLLEVCDWYEVPVFMKGNLDWQPAYRNFPDCEMMSHE